MKAIQTPNTRLEKAKQIHEQIYHGLDSIDPNATVTMSVRDLMLIHNTMGEFVRFFHQPERYPTMEEIGTYLGTVDFGAFAMMSHLYYKVLSPYIPQEIHDKFGDEDDPFDPPNYPYYYKVKNDKNIDDGTLQVTDRASFIEYVIANLKSHPQLSKNDLSEFIETIGHYANDIEGYYQNMGFDSSADTPTWRIFAQILQGAIVYE